MAAAIGQILSLAVGVALSPLPIVAVVLMLASARGRTNGPAFLAGWVAGLGAVSSVAALLAGGADAAGAGVPAAWVGWLKILLGVLLLFVAARQWRGRPRGDTPPALPGWMKTIDTLGPGKSAGLAVTLSAVNPKNLLLTVAAAAAVVQTGLPAGQQAVALLVFVLLASLSVGTPVVLYLALGERSRHLLDALRTWLTVHNTAIMTVVLLVLGLKLFGDGISVL